MGFTISKARKIEGREIILKGFRNVP